MSKTAAKSYKPATHQVQAKISKHANKIKKIPEPQLKATISKTKVKSYKFKISKGLKEHKNT